MRWKRRRRRHLRRLRPLRRLPIAFGWLDYTHGEVADAVSGVDVALDTVGGATTTSLLPALREGGTLVTIAYPRESGHARGKIVLTVRS